MLVKLSSAKAAFLRFPPRCWGRQLLSAGDKGRNMKKLALSHRATATKHDLRPPLDLFFYPYVWIHKHTHTHTQSELFFGVIFLLSYLWK